MRFHISDSLYLAISGEKLDDVIKPELLGKWVEVKSGNGIININEKA